MSLNTWGNNTEGNTENAETWTSDSWNVLSQFYKGFSEHIIKDLNPDETNTEIERFMKIDSLSGDDLKYVIDYKGRYEKFDWVKPDDIELWAIKRELRKEFLTRRSLYQSMKTSILKEFDITSAQYSDLNFDTKIKTLELNKITEYVKSPKKLECFIANFCEEKSIDIFERKWIKSLFDELSIPDRFKTKLDTLSKDDRDELISQMNIFRSTDINSEVFAENFNNYVSTLLEKELLSYTEISELLKIYAPYISLKSAKKINSNIDENVETKKQLSALDELKFSELDNATQNEIVSKINPEDIFIPTEDLFTLPHNGWVHIDSIKKVIESGLLKSIWEDIQNTSSLNENEWGPQHYSSFIRNLKEKKEKVINPEQFVKGNYIIVTEKIKKDWELEWEEKKVYYQIVSDGSDQPLWSITLASMWEWMYSSNNSKNASITYKDWSDYLDKWNPDKWISVDKCEIYSEKAFKDKINSWEVLDDQGTTDFKYDETDLQWYTQQKIQAKRREYQNKYENLKESTDEEIDQVINENEGDYIQEFEDEEELYNINHLKAKLKELDESWEDYGFETGTTISYIDDNKQTQYFSIEKADITSVRIKHNDSPAEVLWYTDFYEAFKSQDAKRINKTADWDAMLENLWNIEDHKGGWAWISISSSGSLIKKDETEESDEETEFEYIEWEGKFIDDCDVIKVHNISNGFAKISFWKKTWHEKLEDEKAQKAKEDKEKKEWKKINYNMYSNTETIPVWVLQAYIEKAAWTPKSFKEENSPEKHNDPESVQRHGSFASRFFQKASINDLLAGWKLLVDSIESMLKEWTDEQAAKMLENLWLPDSVKIDVTMRVEQASKKRMDEFKDRLWGMDSWLATKMIAKVLTNKDSPESMKEASIMFMAEKYGTLYEKWALHKYKGTFLRYEAFWWRIWDDSYRKVKAECKQDGVNFTEHELMIRLLWDQCKDKRKPKRRSKLHKEYKAMMWKWKWDEKEKWTKDAWEKRTVDWRLFIAYDELKDWAYLNSMWALKSVIWKWDGWHQEKLNEIPFIMMTSWDAYTYDQDTTDGFKNDFWPNGHPLPATFFVSKPWFIDIYNDAVLEVCRIMSEDDWKHGDMYEKAKALILDNKDIKSDDKNSKQAKIIQAKKFYWKYWKTICRVMNMLNTRQTDDVAKYERMIWLQRENNPIFKDYYGIFNAAVTSETDFSKDDDTISDAFYSWPNWAWGISGMDAKKVFTDMLQPQTGTSSYRMKKWWKMIEQEMIAQLSAFRNIDYTEEDRLEIVTDYIHGYFTAMMTHMGTRWFDSMVKNYKPMKILWVKASDFNDKVALDFENDEPETMAISRKYAERWIWNRNVEDNNDSFSHIPGSIVEKVNDIHENREASDEDNEL